MCSISSGVKEENLQIHLWSCLCNNVNEQKINWIYYVADLYICCEVWK